MNKNSDNLVRDAAAVRCILQGDNRKFAQLYDLYEPKVRRYIFSFVRDQNATSDILQDTFLKAYRNLRVYDQSRPFSSWIYRIAHNETLNYIKKNQKHRQIEDYDATNSQLISEFKKDKEIDRRFLRQSMLSCIQVLKPKYEEVVRLYYYEHLSYKEISDVLLVPVSTVGVRLRRAIKQLKNICDEQGVHYE